MKHQIRLIGIDDCPFDKFADKGKKIKIVGVLFRGGEFLDGVSSEEVTVDGDDATEAIIRMVSRDGFKEQLQGILLGGVNVAGFNLIDLNQIYEKTGLPILVVVRKQPNVKNFIATLKKLGFDKKVMLIKKLGIPKKHGKLFVQAIGYDEKQVNEILRITCTHSNIPEPIRVAHLIAAGITKGVSKGRA